VPAGLRRPGLAAADPEAVAREPRRARFFVAHARALLSGKPQVLDIETNGAAAGSSRWRKRKGWPGSGSPAAVRPERGPSLRS
jgi:hypothetical protein